MRLVASQPAKSPLPSIAAEVKRWAKSDAENSVANCRKVACEPIVAAACVDISRRLGSAPLGVSYARSAVAVSPEPIAVPRSARNES